MGNLRFASAVEPDNATLQQYVQHCEAQRARHLPTLPSTIGVERDINPFLRSRQPLVAHAVQSRTQAEDEVSVFAALREWKNKF
jgi:hydroxyacylglutathione hydrolase